MVSEDLRVLVTINAATLGAIIIFGYRVMRFINRIEFRTELMWRDYERRMDLESVEEDGA